jgi:hypothetical protein
MEDVRSPQSAAITYALLSFISGMISAQADVIKIWYERRAYERSRGEMVTMLYEKTLNRKVVGVQFKTETEQSNGTSTNGNETPTEETPSKSPKSTMKKLWERVTEPFRRSDKHAQAEEDGKQAASMGKILNLMRYVSSESSLINPANSATEMMFMKLLKGDINSPPV